MSDLGPEERTRRLKTALLVLTVVSGIIVFFAVYHAASQPDDSDQPQNCIRDPRNDSWSCTPY